MEKFNEIMQIEKDFINVLGKVFEYLSKEETIKIKSGKNELPIEFTFKGTTIKIIPELEGIDKKFIAVYSQNPITEKFQRLAYDFNIGLTGYPINDIRILEDYAIKFTNWLINNLQFSIIRK